MAEMDKIIHQLASVMNWLRTGKEHPAVRAELYSAAAKTCEEIAGRIAQALQENGE